MLHHYRVRVGLSQHLIRLLLVAGIMALLIGGIRNMEQRSRPTDAMPTVTPAAATAAPVRITVYDVQKQEPVEMELETYLYHVVAAEMPASYHMEALKAQCVAARTYTWYRQMVGGCSRSPGAAICTQSDHCQAFSTLEELEQTWGKDHVMYREKILNAVSQTRGQILTYQGVPIQTLYHAAAGGHTEDVEHVFSQALPYLRGVESDDLSTKYDHRQQIFTRQEAADALNAAHPAANVQAASLQDQIRILSHFPSGRVHEIRVGEVTLTGVDVRRALDIRSAMFSIDFSKEQMIVTTNGFGHGVGMSQLGANRMAEQGMGYADILTHYYTGVALTSLT